MPFDWSRKAGRDDPDRQIRRLLNQRESLVARRSAARDLSQHPPSSQVLLALAEVLDDDDTVVRDHARAGVAASGSLGVEMLNALLPGSSANAVLAARALAHSREDKAVDLLASCLGDTRVEVVSEAAISLALLGDARAIGPLSALLTSGWPVPGKAPSRARRIAIATRVLASLSNPLAVETLCCCLNSCDEVAEAAADALGKLRYPAAINALANAATVSTSPRVRYAAANALYQTGDPGAIQAMCHLLADPRPATCSLAARFLGQVDDAVIQKHLEGNPDAAIPAHLRYAIRNDNADAELQSVRMARLLCCVELLPLLRKRTRQLPLPGPDLARELDRAIAVIERRLSTVGNRPIPASAPAADIRELPVAADRLDLCSDHRPIPADRSEDPSS